MSRVKRSLRQLEQEGNHAPSIAQLAPHCQMPLTQVKKFLGFLHRPAPSSFDELPDSSREIYRAQSDSLTPYDVAVQKELHAHLAAYLPRLDEVSRRIIELRYGLHNGLLYTHQQIADHLSLSRSRVMRMEKDALRRLRDFFHGL